MTDTDLDTLQIILIIIIPSLIAGVPAALSAIAAWKSNRKKKAEALTEEGTAAEKVSAAWEKLATDLQTRIDRMEARQIVSDDKIKRMDSKIERQAKRVRYLEHGVQILIEQVKSMGATPAFILEEQPEEEKGE